MSIEQTGTPRHRGLSKKHLKEMHGGGTMAVFKPKRLDTQLLNCLVNNCCNLIDADVRSFKNYMFLSLLYRSACNNHSACVIPLPMEASVEIHACLCVRWRDKFDKELPLSLPLSHPIQQSKSPWPASFPGKGDEVWGGHVTHIKSGCFAHNLSCSIHAFGFQKYKTHGFIFLLKNPLYSCDIQPS